MPAVIRVVSPFPSSGMDRDRLFGRLDGLRSLRRLRYLIDESHDTVVHDMPLLVDGDEMIAVVEDERLDHAAELALQILRIADAGDVVLPRLDHHGPLAD